MIKSKTTTKQTNLNQFSFKLQNATGTIKEIHEQLLNTQQSAKNRAVAEFLTQGMLKQEIEFETYFSDLNINDIISIYAPKKRIPKDLSKDRFIVKKVIHNFKDGVIKSTIKAERYD